MIDVARKIFSFLLILFLIMLSFVHAFLVLLRPIKPYLDDYDDDYNDPNLPQDLTDTYVDDFDKPNLTLHKQPDEYTNLFFNYSNSLLGMYLFITVI